MTPDSNVIADLLGRDRDAILRDWLDEARNSSVPRSGDIASAYAREAADLLDAVRTGLQGGGSTTNLAQPVWQRLTEILQTVSRDGAARGATAAETSSFVLAFKRPLFARLQKQLADDTQALIGAIWAVSTLVDVMAETTLTTYQRTREDIINRQQQELLELSTPVVKLWDGILAVPMIGTLDSSRTQLVMETLLQRIVETGSELAIIDITGVPTVDTLVAQHLLKTVTAIRLMGADCIVSGVRPQIAQTIVHLGIDLQGVTTKATLADALSLAMKRAGYTVTRAKAA
ncbi:MAG: STAS domain-containing protein [Proteobacteria bacterium]|nr:STAS domain-containing protein [Pseudomonadota bacterium]